MIVDGTSAYASELREALRALVGLLPADYLIDACLHHDSGSAAAIIRDRLLLALSPEQFNHAVATRSSMLWADGTPATMEKAALSQLYARLSRQSIIPLLLCAFLRSTQNAWRELRNSPITSISAKPKVGRPPIPPLKSLISTSSITDLSVRLKIFSSEIPYQLLNSVGLQGDSIAMTDAAVLVAAVSAYARRPSKNVSEYIDYRSLEAFSYSELTMMLATVIALKTIC